MTTTLFDFLTPLPILHGLHWYSTIGTRAPGNSTPRPLQLRTSSTRLENLIRIVIAENAPDTRLGRVVGGMNRVLVDTEGGHVVSDANPSPEVVALGYHSA
jgi:hypothetical protein